MKVEERFLHYVSFGTNSDEFCENCPSSPMQTVLGAEIAAELKRIGLTDVRQDEHGYVYGYLPGEGEALGFIAHMDTSPSVCGDNICPSIINYEGGDIPLAKKGAIKTADYPYLEAYKGKRLIVTDGTTLLGADDKAGVAEIITACEELLAEGGKHRPIAVAFTPDEEIGRGADLFDIKNFPAKEAYTLDGGELGELENETFNAAGCEVRIHGFNIHPGSAKDKMVSAVLLGVELINMLPPAETPAHTCGYEGFYHVTDFSGDESEAVVRMIIRDHDRAKFEARKAYVTRLVKYLQDRYGEERFELLLRDSYYNMKEKIEPEHRYLIDNAVEAFKSQGVTARIIPIRGGTDGSRLSYEGLPCPNLSVGGANFHGPHEFCCIEDMECMVRVVKELVKQDTKKNG